MIIACVDDDPMILKLLKLIFSKSDFAEVITYESPKQALEELPAKKPDLILIDYMMPEMNGPELLVKLSDKIELKNSSFIFLSAHENLVEFEILSESNVIGHIKKPFNPKTIVEEIKKIYKEKS